MPHYTSDGKVNISIFPKFITTKTKSRIVEKKSKIILNNHMHVFAFTEVYKHWIDMRFIKKK